VVSEKPVTLVVLAVLFFFDVEVVVASFYLVLPIFPQMNVEDLLGS
jgi:hypothetical protein